MLFATLDGQLNALAITPDGTHIIVGGDNGVVVLDRVTAQVVHRLTGHTTPVRALAVTPSGRQIISASAGGTVRVWDRETGKQIGEPYAGHSGLTMAVTPDGSQIISGDDAGELIIWDRLGGQEFGRMIPVHDGHITAVAVTPDGEQIVSAGRDGAIRVSKITTGESRSLQEPSSLASTMALVLSPDGAQIISGGSDGLIRVWNIATGELVGKPMSGHALWIESVAMSADGSRLASAGQDGTVRIWDLATGHPMGEPFTAHDVPARAVAFTPDGQQVISAGKDGAIQIWDRPNRGAVYAIGDAVHAVAVTPDGNEIISGGRDGTVKVWYQSASVETFAGHTGPIYALVLMSSGLIVSGSDDRLLRLWDGHDVREIATGHIGGIWAIVADGDRIISAGRDKTIQIWDSSTGEAAGEIATSHTGGISAIALTPDRTRIISGGADGTVRIWNRATGGRVGEPLSRHTSEVTAVAVTSDGSRIISGSQDGTVRIWDLATGTPVGEPLAGHDGKVWAVVLTSDSGRIVSGGEDGSVRVWDRFNGRLVESFTGHVGEVYALAAAGSQIISGGEDGTVRIWDLGVRPAVQPVRLAEVVSDLESVEDRLGIAGDVETIAAVVAALSTRPPLSVALLGDWGIGKSSFMRQVRDRVEELARHSRGGESTFAANVRQVRFNAWHYSDDHLWVGLVEHLFRELARPADDDGPGDRRQELEAELSTKKVERDRLVADLRTVERIERRHRWLAPFRSASVARAVATGVWRELRSAGWRMWLFVLGMGVAIAGMVLGPGLLRLLGTVVAALAPTVVVWKGLGEYTEAARRRLLARKSEVDADIVAVEEELTKVDPARRLDKLLQEISTADRYESYRGLTGRIHHDLRRLSDDLAAAREQWNGSGAPPLQRIVLYVDDLDRCTPSRVVDVLQAVNLLLTMELFVVVVAVDPRWLLRSLKAHHEGLFDDNEVAYLDKIFHIPVALRPMGDHAVGYLRSLLPLEETPAAEPVVPVVQQRRQVEVGEPRPSVEVAAAPARAVATAKVAARAVDLNPEGLRLRSVEREFLERLTPLLGTPRAIKKLVNLYRLLRLGVRENHLDDFIGGDQGGQYQAAALLLAALVGAPHDARKLLQGLASAEPGKDIVDVVPSPRLRELIVEIRKDVPVHGDPATYQRWAATVARYGFETYDLFSG